MPSVPDSVRMKADLAALVGIDTQNPPGAEHPGAQFVGSLMSAAGFEVRYDQFQPNRTNVIGVLANGDGPTFGFNTHIDVVPAGAGWSADPFILREDSGRLYGRGACDAKGPLIAMIEAMRLLSAARDQWKGTLVGVFVADEEVASLGARHFAKSRPKIDYVVVGEPTSNGTIIAHKGSLRPVVRVHGVSAHSGTPDLGENAIYRACQLIGLVNRHHLDIVRLRTHPLVGPASLTVTRARAGIADNVVPDSCDLMLDRRLVPGEDEGSVKRDIEALLQSARDAYGLRCDILEYKPTTGGASETAPDHPIVAASRAAGTRHGVIDDEPRGFQGGCDLVHFRAIGAQGTVIGPGSLAVAHKPDEYVPVDEFIGASLIYRDVALAMLGG